MEWVVDSSIALAWGLPDEQSPDADAFLGGLKEGDVLWVPALWWYEVANGLTVAHRKHRLAEADRIRLIALYGELPLRTDAASGPDAVTRFHTLAREHGLSAYDAAYLELAQRRGAALATLDRALLAAAERAGVIRHRVTPDAET